MTSAFAVPIGVIVAAVISFIALRWATSRNIAAQTETLKQTLAAQERMNLATLESQRLLAQADRLFDKRHSAYSAVVASANTILSLVRTWAGPMPPPPDGRLETSAIAPIYEAACLEFSAPRSAAEILADQPLREAFDEYRSTLSYISHEVHFVPMGDYDTVKQRADAAKKYVASHIKLRDAIRGELQAQSRLPSA